MQLDLISLYALNQIQVVKGSPHTPFAPILKEKNVKKTTVFIEIGNSFLKLIPILCTLTSTCPNRHLCNTTLLHLRFNNHRRWAGWLRQPKELGVCCEVFVSCKCQKRYSHEFLSIPDKELQASKGCWEMGKCCFLQKSPRLFVQYQVVNPEIIYK